MNRNKLISLALGFASFLLDRIEVDKIILFGSVASNSFDKESDIDLFIETDEKDEKKIRNLLDLYKKTKEYEGFRLSGINNEISLKIGRLKEWKELEGSIISEGVVLYGPYESNPSQLKHKRLFLLSLEKMPRKIKVKVWRKLYGYKQKIGNKVYSSSALIEKKIGRGAFLIKTEDYNRIAIYLNENRIKYSFFDVWVE